MEAEQGAVRLNAEVEQDAVRLNAEVETSVAQVNYNDIIFVSI